MTEFKVGEKVLGLGHRVDEKEVFLGMMFKVLDDDGSFVRIQSLEPDGHYWQGSTSWWVAYNDVKKIGECQDCIYKCKGNKKCALFTEEVK